MINLTFILGILLKSKLIFIQLVLVFFGCFKVSSQDWELVSEEFSNTSNIMRYDSLNERLFIIGMFGYIAEEHMGGFAIYDNQSFQSYGCAYDCAEPMSETVFGGSSMVIHNDTLYLTGTQTIFPAAVDSLFNNIPNTKGLLGFTNGDFFPLDVSFQNDNQSSNLLKVYNVDDTLYVTANHFGNVASMSGYGGATYDGYSWVPFLLPGCDNFSGVSDLVKYNGHLYISGSFNSCNGAVEVDNVMKLEGQNWASLAEPIISGVSFAIKNMVVFQNELYVSGNFRRSFGNAGECIMKWNGSEWSDLGVGMTENGTNFIFDMEVLNGELVIAGRFTEVGGIEVENIAKWNGTEWCSISHEFSSLWITEMEVVNNELFLFASTEDYSNRLWKWTGTATTCSEEFNSVSEQSEPKSLALYPNPASDLLTITLPKQLHGSGTISIIDGLGRTIEEFTKELDGSGQVSIATLNLAVGLYNLKFRHEEGVYAARFVKE